MIKQDVVIIFPNLKLQLPTVELFLEPETINTSFIQEVKNTATEAVAKYVLKIHDSIYREVFASNVSAISQPSNRFALGRIVFYVDNNPALTSEPWEVASISTLSKSFTESIEGLLFTSIFNIVKEVLQAAPVTIKLIDEDIDIKVTLVYEGNYRWSLPLTSVQLKQEQGKAIKIRYGNHLHQALYLIDKYGKDVHKNAVSLETVTSLELLELIDSTHQFLLEKGRQVLDTLNQFKPDEQPDLLQHFAGDLLVVHTAKDISPVRKYSVENGYISSDAYTDRFGDNRAGVTEKGKEWLREHSKDILHKGNLTKSKKIALIPYMPIEYLSPFLTSDEADEREAAKIRMDELTVGQGEEV